MRGAAAARTPAAGAGRRSARLRLLLGGVASLVLASPAPVLAAPAADWDWPVGGQPEVVRRFAPGPTPYSPGHYGADLRGAAGDLVLAAGSGTVSYAGLVAGRGVVVVQHGRLRTTYEPVAAAVGVGDVVRAGAVLGVLQPGHRCPGGGACLHWGLRRGDGYLDPLRLVGGGPVRLLPLDGTIVAGAASPAGAKTQVDPRAVRARGRVKPAGAGGAPAPGQAPGAAAPQPPLAPVEAGPLSATPYEVRLERLAGGRPAGLRRLAPLRRHVTPARGRDSG